MSGVLGALAVGFLDLSTDDRVRLTIDAISNQRTVLERWSDFEEKESSGWPRRLAVIARMLEECRSVADIGCGMMQLRQALAEG
ncbi:hypothetical protein AB4144_22815, partial [Rhizobiaceae sp. 2RAB30]